MLHIKPHCFSLLVPILSLVTNLGFRCWKKLVRSTLDSQGLAPRWFYSKSKKAIISVCVAGTKALT